MNQLTIDGLRRFAVEYVAGETERISAEGWWKAPLLATAPIDSRFDILPEIAADDHLRPHDLLPTGRSLIAFFIPFKESLLQENSPGERPCRNWGLAYVQTNDLIGRLTRAFEEQMKQYGYHSEGTPPTHNFDESKLMARWSHKHLAHLVNLGRFGVHNMLITPAGCAGRMGSLVTEAEFGENGLIGAQEACLVKAGHKCGKCLEACPVNALREDGFNRRGCWDRLNENRRELESFSDLPQSTHVCGKCAAMMPCSFTNPVRSP